MAKQIYHLQQTFIRVQNDSGGGGGVIVNPPTGPGSSVGRVSAPGNGKSQFGPRYTKVVKNGTSCSSLDTQTYEVELGLVDPVPA